MPFSIRPFRRFPVLMTTRILLTVILAVVFTTTAWSAETTQAVDFIRFADNGNGVVVDLPGLVDALRNGADPNWVNRENKRVMSTLDHFVFMCSLSTRPRATDADCTQAIKTLIAAGAKLQPVDHEILYFPVAKGKKEIVALLLTLGVDATSWPNKQIDTPLNPVELAVQNGHQAVADLVVAHGATKPKEKDAIQIRFVEAAWHGSSDLLDELLKQGANVNEKGRDGEAALVNAVGGVDECDSYKKTRLLLNAGANPNISGKMWRGTTTPLHRAVYAGSFVYASKESPQCSEALLSELITRGAHVSSLDSNGRTPLHIAAERNHLFAARLLLKAGAKVMPRDKEGKTPLDLAESGEMIKLLKSHGATER